jgi:2-polyprenyl-6-methoxyphenol hydroxylase-like FAD-dependent oxidoreductase
MAQEIIPQTPAVISREQATCCVVGAGPAGAVLSFMLARECIPVILLESHLDFDRDFRGDTLHPAILEVMDELGLADRLLQLPHTKLSLVAPPAAAGSRLQFDLHELKTKFPYIAFMPQSRFLVFITSEAQRFSSFRLVMGARVEELLEEAGQVRGVRYRALDGWHEVRALLNSWDRWPLLTHAPPGWFRTHCLFTADGCALAASLTQAR